MRLLPQLLTRTGVPNIAAAPARLPPEWWPASGRNGGPLHVGAVAHFNIGMLARFASEYPARFRRNSQPEAEMQSKAKHKERAYRLSGLARIAAFIG